MANYCGYGRSNYFRVKDMDVFREFIGEYATELSIEEGGEDSICLIHEGECGDLPSTYEMPDPQEGFGEEVQINFLELLSKHLVEEDGNIFVWQTVGHEKLRYLTGYAEAVDHHGREVWISIDGIYKKCKEELGHEPATKAMY